MTYPLMCYVAGRPCLSVSFETDAEAAEWLIQNTRRRP